MSRCSEIYTTTTSKTISGTTCDPTVISKTMLDLFVFFLSSNCATFSSISTIFLVVILIIKKYQYFILQNLQVLISACIWWDLRAAMLIFSYLLNEIFIHIYKFKIFIFMANDCKPENDGQDIWFKFSSAIFHLSFFERKKSH